MLAIGDLQVPSIKDDRSRHGLKNQEKLSSRNS